MAVRITEPANLNPQTADWQQILNKLTTTTGGFLVAGLTHIDDAQPPQVMEGSRFEISGSFYKTTANETIGTSGLADGTAYIYAAASGDRDSASFKYSSTPPSFQPAKGGWYYGNERAIAKLFYNSSGNIYGNKVILDSYSAMTALNMNYVPTASGGTLIESISGGNLKEITLNQGWHWADMQGGSGGAGGKGGGGSGGNNGLSGEAGNRITISFYVPYNNVAVRIVSGTNGENGGNGFAGGSGTSGSGGGSSGSSSSGSGGGGGGGGGGLPSSINFLDRFIITDAGRGGAGGSGGGGSGGNGGNGGNGGRVGGNGRSGSGGSSGSDGSYGGGTGGSAGSGGSGGGGGRGGIAGDGSGGGYVKIYRIG